MPAQADRTGTPASYSASEPPRVTFPQLTYINLPPITFDAQGVEVRNDVQPGPTPPHIENSIPVAPAWAAERWARDRLRVNGAGGRRVRVLIKSGSVIQVNLARQTGISTSPRTYAKNPAAFKALGAFRAALAKESTLDPVLRELVRLKIAGLNRCRY